MIINGRNINMNEQWVKWEPINGLSAKYYIDSVSDSLKGFQIVLSDSHDEKQKILITFKNSVDAYRNTDETYRTNTISTLDEEYGTNFYGDWTFFKVMDSSYLKWLSEESCTISDSRNLKHFSFVAVNSILDVVTNYEPLVECLDTTTGNG